ncbi:MAG: hypothetical protein KTR14_06780 [Vampirovibrio sp.]|nr:hypothetical protein [Vampirovibrio sp.]
MQTPLSSTLSPSVPAQQQSPQLRLSPKFGAEIKIEDTPDSYQPADANEAYREAKASVKHWRDIPMKTHLKKGWEEVKSYPFDPSGLPKDIKWMVGLMVAGVLLAIPTALTSTSFVPIAFLIPPITITMRFLDGFFTTRDK